MGLMVMRRRDPEWSSYGSVEKGKKYCHQIHVNDAAHRANKDNPLIYTCANLHLPYCNGGNI